MSCSIPEELSFHSSHLWVKADETLGEAYIGVSDFAQKQLGSIVFVELPRVGQSIDVDNAFGTVESYKVVSDLIAPLSGEVLEFNGALKDAAGTLNADCYGAGWLVKIKLHDAGQLSSLLTAGDYRALVGA